MYAKSLGKSVLRGLSLAAVCATAGCAAGGGYGLPALPASALPAGWSAHGYRGAAQCGVETENIRFLKWAPKGSQDIFGQGYAQFVTGFVFAPPRGWPQFQGTEMRPDDVVATVSAPGRSGSRSVRQSFKLMGHPGGLVFARLDGGGMSSIEMFQALMASGEITVTLPGNFRGYQPVTIRFDGNSGRRAYAWMRQTCDGYSTPGWYLNP